MSFLGFFSLDDTVYGTMLAKDDGTLTDPDSLPTYRIYGPDGLVPGGTGTASYLQEGTITGATNASPIVITSASHGLQNGQRVTVSGVGGNTAANGTFKVANVTTDTFELSGSTGNGAYTSGGTWHLTGQFKYSHAALAASGFERDTKYTVLGNFVYGSAVGSADDTFIVV